jgi:cytochrome c oxidase subunit 2
MRMSQDAIPGTQVPVWFRPIKSGEYEIVCSQLCGAGHGAMRATMKVEEQAEYDAWQKEQASLKPAN